jgi:anthranilate synthase component 1
MLRTALLKDGQVHIQAGAGVVADSVPAAEYQETVNKAAALFKAVAMAEQF